MIQARFIHLTFLIWLASKLLQNLSLIFFESYSVLKCFLLRLQNKGSWNIPLHHFSPVELINLQMVFSPN